MVLKIVSRTNTFQREAYRRRRLRSMKQRLKLTVLACLFPLVLVILMAVLR